MRRKEQYGMTWEKIDFLNNLITVPRAKQPRAEQGKVRHVRMNSRVAAVLSALKAPDSEGRVHQLKSPRSWFEPAVKAAKLNDFCWHSLRHTFVSRLAMAGVDLRTVMELAGHQSIQMTMRYAHLAPGHEQSAGEKLVPTATSTATEQNERASDRQTVVQ
jgi:integrase